MVIAVFPPGLSFGNTLQCSMSFLKHNANWTCWLVTTEETHQISEKISEKESRIRIIPQNDLTQAILGAGDDVEFHFLIGPGTREIQLECISALFNTSHIPKLWFIEENISKNDKRYLRNYYKSKIDLISVSGHEIQTILSTDDVNFIEKHGLVWDVNTNRFTFKVIIPPDAHQFNKAKIRKFQDRVIQTFQDAKNRFGTHGVIGSHEPIPNTWSVQSHDRFQKAGIRGGLSS